MDKENDNFLTLFNVRRKIKQIHLVPKRQLTRDEIFKSLIPLIVSMDFLDFVPSILIYLWLSRRQTGEKFSPKPERTAGGPRL